MAATTTTTFTLITIISFLFLSSSALAALDRNHSDHDAFFRFGREKKTHLHFFFHDIVTGPNPTAITVVQSPLNNSDTGFGDVTMIDDPLTEGPERTSKLIGRAQGFYASASKSDVALLMTLNYVFVEGKYNGSTLAILGRNYVGAVREMSVVGGTGYFRLARGFALARTHFFNATTGDAAVEYNVYVLHR